jgi:hypothetical protein
MADKEKYLREEINKSQEKRWTEVAKTPKGTQPVKISGLIKYGSKECGRNRSQYSDGRMYSKAEEWFAMQMIASKLSSSWRDLVGPFLK